MIDKFSFVYQVEQCLANIRAFNPRINSMITDLSEQALDEALHLDRIAETGAWPGLLYGLPMSVKDCIDVRAVRTTFGSGAFVNNIAQEDATVVARARAAGTVVVGKDNLNEWCYGGTTQNDHFGICRNPWDLNCIPGGSSGGSAASVAAGMSLVAFGSDTGGSVRMPAALCGLAGLRPTLGRLSNFGTVSLTSQFDTVGPMAYRVADVARAFVAAAGYDRQDPLSVRHPLNSFLPSLSDSSLAGVKIGIPRSFFFENLGPQVQERVESALRQMEALGATLIDVQLDGAHGILADAALVAAAEVAYRHKNRIEYEPQTLGPEILRRMKTGFDVQGIDMAAALERIQRWGHVVRRALDEQVHVIATPTTPITAPEIKNSADMVAITGRLLSFTYTFTPTGLPAITVPCGFDASGLPIGIQLVGAQFDEPLLLRAGAAYQSHTEFHKARPPLIQIA